MNGILVPMDLAGCMCMTVANKLCGTVDVATSSMHLAMYTEEVSREHYCCASTFELYALATRRLSQSTCRMIARVKFNCKRMRKDRCVHLVAQAVSCERVSCALV